VYKYNVTPQYAIDYIRAHRTVAFYRGVNFKKTIDKVYQQKKNGFI
jgi:hypothetical protein